MLHLALLPYILGNGRDLEIIGLVIGIIFWVQMIRFCITREPHAMEKMLWLAFMICVPGIGSVIYFFTRVSKLRG